MKQQFYDSPQYIVIVNHLQSCPELIYDETCL